MFASCRMSSAVWCLHSAVEHHSLRGYDAVLVGRLLRFVITDEPRVLPQKTAFRI